MSLNNGIEDAVDGALFANTVIDTAFRERYQQRFGDVNALVDGALAYEFAVLVKDLFKSGPAPETPEEFLSRFETVSDRDSICGRYHFSDSPEAGKHFTFPIAVGEMRNGRPRPSL